MTRRSYERGLYFFDGPAVKHTIALPDGFRFLVFMRGHSPSAAPIDEPGIYEVDAELLPEGEWPMCLTTIDAAHVAALESMPADRVDELLDAIAAEHRKARD